MIKKILLVTEKKTGNEFANLDEVGIEKAYPSLDHHMLIKGSDELQHNNKQNNDNEQ